LRTPPQGEEYKPLRGVLFPSEYPSPSKPGTEPLWAWMKYFRNANNYFVLPKNTEFINMEVV
jgi:hypothetical protein